LIQEGQEIPLELAIRPRGHVASNARAAANYRNKYPERVQAGIEERRERNRSIVIEIKHSPCADCSQIFPPVCMDFDHRTGEEKIYGRTGGVARLVNTGSSVEKLLAEIQKCDLVCANCHRIRTGKEQGWHEDLLSIGNNANNLNFSGTLPG
jgi:hypothetical protein